jgi:hypothetical protein
MKYTSLTYKLFINSRITTYTCLLIFVFINSSCNKILLTLKGYKSPRFETYEHLDKTAMKYQIDTALCLYAKDTFGLKVINDFTNGLPGVAVVNKEGTINVYYPKNTSCPGPVENYLRNLCTSTPEWTITKRNESSLKGKIYYRDGRPFDPTELKDTLHIYFTWAEWQNKANKKVKEWEALVKSLKDCGYSIRWINQDILGEIYGIDRRKKIDLGVSIKKE